MRHLFVFAVVGGGTGGTRLGSPCIDNVFCALDIAGRVDSGLSLVGTLWRAYPGPPMVPIPARQEEELEFWRNLEVGEGSGRICLEEGGGSCLDVGGSGRGGYLLEGGGSCRLMLLLLYMMSCLSGML